MLLDLTDLTSCFDSERLTQFCTKKQEPVSIIYHSEGR